MTLRSRDGGKTHTDDTVYSNVNHEVTGDDVAEILTDLWDSVLLQDATGSVVSALTTDLSHPFETFLLVDASAATVTSFGVADAGVTKFLRFAGALTLTHNATSLIIPGGANIVTAAGDHAMVHSEGSGNWRVLFYGKASGKAIIASSLSDIVASGALPYVDWTDVASATTADIGAIASNFVRITGTTTITGLGTAAATVWRYVRFAAALTLTYNGTSLILPGLANIKTGVGDVAMFKSEGSGNWRCLWYSKRSGLPFFQEDFETLASATTTDLSTTASNFVLISGTTTITSFGSGAAGLTRLLKFSGALTLTHGANLALPAGGANITTANGDTALAHSVGSGAWRVLFYTRASGKPLVGPAAADITDYAEGTFTPTIVSTGGGAPTYSQQVGFYTKIGNRVFWEARIVITSLGTLAAGSVTIGPLPFTPEATTNHHYAQAVSCNNLAAGATTSITAVINAGIASASLNTYAAGTATQLTVAGLTATSVINISGHFAT